MIELNKISICESKITDLHSIHKISESCFKDSWTFKSYKEDFENEFTKYFSLIYKNKLVGFLSILIVIDEITLTNIAIHEAYREKGFGKIFLKYVLEQFKGYKFFLEVRESNTKAINLYHTLKFMEIYKRINYYKNPNENAIVMKKF